MFHIFLSLQSYMFFGIIISFSGISNAGSNEKSCLISMSCVLTYIDVRTLKFFRPAQFWLVNSNFQHSCRKQDCVVRQNLLFCLLSRLTSRPAPLLPHRGRAPEQFENAILFLRLGQPSKLICHERELFGNAGLVWTENVLKTAFYENGDVTIITHGIFLTECSKMTSYRSVFTLFRRCLGGKLFEAFWCVTLSLSKIPIR